MDDEQKQNMKTAGSIDSALDEKEGDNKENDSDESDEFYPYKYAVKKATSMYVEDKDAHIYNTKGEQ